jgi:hypothetical protein
VKKKGGVTRYGVQIRGSWVLENSGGGREGLRVGGEPDELVQGLVLHAGDELVVVLDNRVRGQALLTGVSSPIENTIR